MSHNVTGNCRFAVANKDLRSKDQQPKMWRRKTA